MVYENGESLVVSNELIASDILLSTWLIKIRILVVLVVTSTSLPCVFLKNLRQFA